jgi:hypothetical protein
VNGDDAIGEAGSVAAEALRRELYWAPPPTRSTLAARHHGVPVSPLAARWSSLAGTLRWEYDEMFPPEPLLKVGSGFRLRMKRFVWRYTRPVTRRYDRIGADLAELGFETAQGLEARAEDRGATQAGATPERVAALEERVRELEARLGALDGEESPPEELP